jgi:hypothetical protein
MNSDSIVMTRPVRPELARGDALRFRMWGEGSSVPEQIDPDAAVTAVKPQHRTEHHHDGPSGG